MAALGTGFNSEWDEKQVCFGHIATGCCWMAIPEDGARRMEQMWYGWDTADGMA